MEILELKKRANDVRKGIIEAVHGAKAGHPGGSLSAADIFTYLYFEEMHIDPSHPKMGTASSFRKDIPRPACIPPWPTGAISLWRICPPCATWALIFRDIPVCSMCRA